MVAFTYLGEDTPLNLMRSDTIDEGSKITRSFSAPGIETHGEISR
jgi:hypothetical protein